MAKLVYSALGSLDGYIADEHGKFDWAEPDDEVHAFINDLDREAGTYLYGRRMYEVMAGWETPDALPSQSPLMLDFARIWQAADKIVYSKSLDSVSTARTRLERDFDPDVVRQLKSSTGRDLLIGGPDLAGQAIRAGLVDELQFFIAPVVVGGGNQSLPDSVRLDLELLEARRFTGGMAFLHYRVGK
jgi:dihydrofolate reductase